MPRQTLITLLLSVFIALLGIGIIIPVMPVFATTLGANGFALGMIIAAFSVSRGILQPLVGSLSDRWGRKGFLISGLFIYGLVGLLIPHAAYVSHLIGVRAFHGVGSAMIVPIGMAYMSILAPAGFEARYQSYLNIAIFCGIGCGPIIGGLVSDTLGFSAVFYLMALLSFLACILVIFTMPTATSMEGGRKVAMFANFVAMIRSRRTLGILIARFATMIIMVPTMAFLPLLMNERMSATGVQIGMVIACRTLVNAILQIPAGTVADRYDKRFLLFSGCVGICSCLALIPLVPNLTMMLVLYCVLGCAEAIIWPVLSAYASIEGKNHYGHGAMMGVFSLAMSLGVFIGATVSGKVMDIWGVDAAYWSTALVVMLLCSGALLMIGNRQSDPRSD
ncbi:MAG: MFS transporter [Desulfobulbaceae bacterium]|nr:MAG: MFS transporter [Desulfobulbaceae bacterium]